MTDWNTALRTAAERANLRFKERADSFLAYAFRTGNEHMPSHTEVRIGSFKILREELLVVGFGKPEAPQVFFCFMPPGPDSFTLKLEQYLTEQDTKGIERKDKSGRTYTIQRFMPMRLRPHHFPLSSNETSKRRPNP